MEAEKSAVEMDESCVSCDDLGMVPASEIGVEVEELIMRITEYVEEAISLEETIALEEDSEQLMEALLRKQHLEDCIVAIAEYVEETIAVEEEKKAIQLADRRRQDMDALVEAIAEYVEETIALEEEEEEIEEAVEEYVVDMKKALEDSKQELTTARSGVLLLETWYVNSSSSSSTAAAADKPFKGTGSCKRDFQGNVRSIHPR